MRLACCDATTIFLRVYIPDCKDKLPACTKALILPKGCAYGDSNCDAQSIIYPIHQLSSSFLRVNEMTIKILQRRKSNNLSKIQHYINILMFALLQ